MLIMKDGKVRPTHLKLASSPSYTLAEIEQLAKRYVETLPRHVDGEMIPFLAVSRFLEWLKQHEQQREVG